MDIINRLKQIAKIYGPDVANNVLTAVNAPIEIRLRSDDPSEIDGLKSAIYSLNEMGIASPEDIAKSIIKLIYESYNARIGAIESIRESEAKDKGALVESAKLLLEHWYDNKTGKEDLNNARNKLIDAFTQIKGQIELLVQELASIDSSKTLPITSIVK